MKEGLIVSKGVELDRDTAAELKRLRKLEKAHKRLQTEHELLKKPSSGLQNKNRNLPIHPRPQRKFQSERHVPAFCCEQRGLLCLARKASI